MTIHLFLCHDLILLHLLYLMLVYYTTTTTTKYFSSKKVGVARDKSESEPAKKGKAYAKFIKALPVVIFLGV